MKKKTKLWFLLGILSVLSSCVEEYTLPTTTSYVEPEIVIQGRILTGGKSVVYLTNTTPFNSNEEAPDILNAQVHIIGQNGFRSEAAEFVIEEDCYVIDTQALENNTHYAVEVTVDGETYQSEFQPILIAPEISEVTWQENESSVSIYVSTKAGKDDPRHFMWTFEEDWEFHADIDMRGNDTIKPCYVEKHYPDLTETRNPYYYGWIHDVSKKIFLQSTSNLSENLTGNVKIHEIGIEDIRISYIYSILVKQWSLTDEAYSYYNTLKRYTEESGGLFTPVLSDYQGNIRCLSNPTKRVHGWVLASSVTTKRIFIYEENFEHLRSQYSNLLCIAKHRTAHKDEFNAIVTPYPPLSPWVIMAVDANWQNDPNAILYNWHCVDCRYTTGATKKRPDFWPNDHE